MNRNKFKLSYSVSNIVGYAATLTIILVLILFAGTGPVAAQEDDVLPEGVVPPPLSSLSEDEAEKLVAEKSMKDRTKLALEFMDNRLVQSEGFSEKKEFGKSIDQLGYFNALIVDTYRYLVNNEDKKNSLKSFKRFELGLRDFLPRLELVRRALPYSHSYHVFKLISLVRETRRKAIEPFFSDTVLPEGT